MPVTWYCFFHRGVSTGGLSDAERGKVVEAVGSAANLRTAYVHTPSPAPHPYAGEDIAPLLALELEFAHVADCESALRQGGGLRRLGDPGFVPGLAGAAVSQQGMLRRSYAVPDSAPDGTKGLCSYLVHYPGPAEDEQAWLDHYTTTHAPLMCALPGVRAVAVDTPAAVVSGLPFRFARALLRNKVVFDSAQALSAALSSPAREALRTDFGFFPAYDGGSVHVPMETLVVPGSDPLWSAHRP